MSSYFGERNPASWKEQTLDSLAAPPLPLAAFFTLFIMMMYFTNYSDYKETVERSKMGLRLYIFLLPILAILAAYVVTLRHRLWRDLTRPVPEAAAVGDDWSLPWGVVVLLVLVLVLVHYQPPFQSGWFRIV
ncbi:hypothetical protein F511_14187 [Dorcoceras hygrometricum]|uniref:Uncharacterized protein n=1 Tax=Dorcoceras hygrometricum TaxID=472368 RepID=A0A2Z7C5M4_9LAMI|nr:hypothetical protein F511_14187 [Dorcoceras hygrometricum]